MKTFYEMKFTKEYEFSTVFITTKTDERTNALFENCKKILRKKQKITFAKTEPTGREREGSVS